VIISLADDVLSVQKDRKGKQKHRDANSTEVTGDMAKIAPAYQKKTSKLLNNRNKKVKN